MSFEEQINIATAQVSTGLPIFICDLGFIKEQLISARQAIAELQVSHPEPPPSNVHAAYMSPWKSHRLNRQLVPLCESVKIIATFISRKLLSANLDALNMDLLVTDCWGIIYEKSDYTLPHHHFPADFSCSVYLEVEPDASPLYFSENCQIPPKPGMLVLFPGILTHEVRPTAGRRVVIAMNLNKRAMFDKPAT